MHLDDIELLLTSSSQQFLRDHHNDDPSRVALAFSSRKDIPVRALCEQIRCRKKARSKLPQLQDTQFIYESETLEQCSSFATALYKASIFSGDLAVDLTAGLGIDSIALSKQFKKVICCEINETRARLLQTNAHTLAINNIELFNGDAAALVESLPTKADLIYVDPQRRDGHGRHVGFSLCSPDIVQLYPRLQQKCTTLLIKASPLFEHTEVLRELKSVKKIRTVSYKGECKELLIEIQPGSDGVLTTIEAVIIDDTGRVKYATNRLHTETIGHTLIEPDDGGYVYEPDPAIIKGRLSRNVAHEFTLGFINNATDYLYGKTYLSDFPGRTFKIVSVNVWHRKNLSTYLNDHQITRASIARRDFPMDPDALRKMTGLREGGDDVFIFTKNSTGENIVLHCKVCAPAVN